MEKTVYFIFEVQIYDLDKMKPYQARVEETFKIYGGKRIVAGEVTETFEGDEHGQKDKLIIIQFDNIEQARSWYKSSEYQSIINYRLIAAKTKAYLVE